MMHGLSADALPEETNLETESMLTTTLCFYKLVITIYGKAICLDLLSGK